MASTVEDVKVGAFDCEFGFALITTAKESAQDFCWKLTCDIVCSHF